MSNLWRRFLAAFRLNKRLVCEMSVGRGPYDDYHDYYDGVDDDLGAVHEYLYTCRRCGKEFYI